MDIFIRVAAIFTLPKMARVRCPAQVEASELRISFQKNMPPKTKELSAAQRQSIFILLSNSVDPETTSGLEWGAAARVAKIFEVDRATTSRIWRDAQARLVEAGRTIEDVSKDDSFFQPQVHRRGRKIKYNRKEMRKEAKGLPFKQRKTFRSMAVSIGVPLTTLYRMTKTEKVFKRHTSALKRRQSGIQRFRGVRQQRRRRSGRPPYQED
jgi:hypothetical protein